MRPTIVLLTAVGDHRELVDRLRGAGSYREETFFDSLKRGGCRFGVNVSGDVLDEFDEDELAEIAARLGEFRAVLVEYHDAACIRQLLRDVLPGIRGVLDTNHGEFRDYRTALERLDQDPSWDWRSDSDEIPAVNTWPVRNEEDS